MEIATLKAAQLSLVGREEEQRGSNRLSNRLPLRRVIGRDTRRYSITGQTYVSGFNREHVDAWVAKKIKVPASTRKGRYANVKQFEDLRSQFVDHLHSFIANQSRELIRRSWDEHFGETLKTGSPQAAALQGQGRSIILDALNETPNKVWEAVNTGEIAGKRGLDSNTKEAYKEFLIQILGKNRPKEKRID